MVFCSPPDFRRDFTCPALLRLKSDVLNLSFVYGTLTLYGRAFQPLSTRQKFKLQLAFHKFATTLTYNPLLTRPYELTPR